MSPKRYKVTYQVGMSRGSIILLLYGGTESEACEELYRRGTVPRSRDIIILDIELC